MPVITARLEDDDFDYTRFSVDYPDGFRYTFHVNDLTNRQYDDALQKPTPEFMADLYSAVERVKTELAEDDSLAEPPGPAPVTFEDLPYALSANIHRLHQSFLRALGTSLVT